MSLSSIFSWGFEAVALSGQPVAKGLRRDKHRPQQAAAGQCLFGYKVLCKLGTGAASQVYAVTDRLTGNRFALKHVVCHGPRDERYVEQLRREYEIGQHVQHSSLRRSVTLHANRSLLGRTKEAGLVLELVEGQAVTPPVDSLPAAARLLCHLARAVEALHEAGYLHCDLKPQNLLLDRQGRLHLIDFGQACVPGTIKQRVQGTADYIAPEQVRCVPVTAKTDVFGWGATAYALLTGTVVPTLYTVRKGSNSFLLDSSIPPVRDRAPCVPELLSNLVMCCVSSTPEKRPEMREVARRMEAIRYAMRRPDAPARHSSAA